MSEYGAAAVGHKYAGANVDQHLIQTYLRGYGEKYYQENIFEYYPEAKLFPAYIKRYCSQAKTVLDLGFGSGLWFWASFLPALERIDGIDLYQEALKEANRVFEVNQVPAGYRVAHGEVGHNFTLKDLKGLSQKGGYFAFQDYRQPWPQSITQTRYDLVTEHGGGLGQMNSDAEVISVVKRISRVLRPGGCLLFMNFMMASSLIEQKLGREPAPSWHLRSELFKEALRQAGLKLLDFHVLNAPQGIDKVEQLFYGYAQKK